MSNDVRRRTQGNRGETSAEILDKDELSVGCAEAESDDEIQLTYQQNKSKKGWSSTLLENSHLYQNSKNKKVARKIGTWNVRTLLKPEKLANVTKEMERVKIDILGLAETRW